MLDKLPIDAGKPRALRATWVSDPAGVLFARLIAKGDTLRAE
jgi:hypothetical protein